MIFLFDKSRKNSQTKKVFKFGVNKDEKSIINFISTWIMFNEQSYSWAHSIDLSMVKL